MILKNKTVQIIIPGAILEIAYENYHEGEKIHFTVEEANSIQFSNDWRLPTKEELEAISKQMKFENGKAYIYDNEGEKVHFPFASFASYSPNFHGYYWSSTVNETNTVWMLFLTMSEGRVCSCRRDFGFSVRCVRTVL